VALSRGIAAISREVDKSQLRGAPLKPRDTRQVDAALNRVEFNSGRLALRLGLGHNAYRCYRLAEDNLFDIIDVLWSFSPNGRGQALVDEETRQGGIRRARFLTIAGQSFADIGGAFPPACLGGRDPEGSF
jgi:hypothetical protein